MITRPPKLLRLKSDKALEGELRRRIRERLTALRRADPSLELRWSKALLRRPSGMSHFDYARLRLWHRQFEGKATPGLPSAVRAARFLVKQYRKRFSS